MMLEESSIDTLDLQKDNGPPLYWILEEIKTGTSLKAKMTKMKLFYFEHIMRREGSLEETIILGEIEGSRKEEEEIWNELIHERRHRHESTGVEQGYEDRILWTSLMHTVARS